MPPLTEARLQELPEVGSQQPPVVPFQVVLGLPEPAQDCVELHDVPALGEGGQGGGQTHPGEVARPELVLSPHQTAQTPAVPLREQSQSRHGDVDHGDFLRQQPEVSANLLSPGSWQEPAAEPPSSSGMTWS